MIKCVDAMNIGNIFHVKVKTKNISNRKVNFQTNSPRFKEITSCGFIFLCQKSVEPTNKKFSLLFYRQKFSTKLIATNRPITSSSRFLIYPLVEESVPRTPGAL